MRRLVVATANEKKRKELLKYLTGLPVKLLSLNDLAKRPQIREDGLTFKANAIKKALAVSRAERVLTLADDSGLVVEALGGAPGIRSARFAGRAKRDIDNCDKVLRLLEGVPAKRRGAKFVCAVAIADGGKVIKVIERHCSGRIAGAMRGRHGFGYDPLFLIPKYGRTFGELGLKAKDRMSHRAKALAAARAFLKKYLNIKYVVR